MKNLLQGLLICLALALCGLIAFQWVRETDLRKQVQELNDKIHDRMEALQTQQSTLKRYESEIQRLDGLKGQLSQITKSNDLRIASLNKDLEKATQEGERSLHQVEAYKGALQKANDSIVKQNDEIKKQNEEMTKLADDRNDFVKKFNKLAADYNELAAKWNKQQEELAHAATNAPPAKK